MIVERFVLTWRFVRDTFDDAICCRRPHPHRDHNCVERDTFEADNEDGSYHCDGPDFVTTMVLSPYVWRWKKFGMLPLLRRCDAPKVLE